MGVPELLDHTRRWLDVAIERFDDEDYEAVDAACRIAGAHSDLADTEMERQHLDMAKERHEAEMRKYQNPWMAFKKHEGQ